MVSLLEVGSEAPPFEGVDQLGHRVTLADLLTGPVVLYFYPADFTPGCTQEACTFRDGIAGFERAGARVVGVSADTVEEHRRFVDRYHLPFTLIADPEQRIARDYRCVGFFGTTRRITYVITPNGRIAAVFSGVWPARHVEDALARLNDLRSRSPEAGPATSRPRPRT